MDENQTIDQDRIIKINIEEEMKSSYIDYSMSVIVARALPDVRDGFKPVHRRILYGMRDIGNTSSNPYKKCARVVGEVLGKYHPHGDSSVYGALVRLAQDWNMRYTLVDGQGNFGSVDGDSAAAMRYTECRLEKIGEYIMDDLDKDTVDMVPNFDETEINTEELMQYIQAPDFPTGGYIYGLQGVKDAYETGRGRVVMRAKAEIESDENQDKIIITEIPYGVNKQQLIEYIADLVKEGKLEGISNANDESGRQGMRIVIDVKRDANANVLLNKLFKMTALQSSFSVNNIALVKGRPRLLTLKDCIKYFVEHRHDVTIRRTKFELKKAEERAHILEGMIIASDNIDEVVQIIKASRTPALARTNLEQRFNLDELQSQAIVDMRLSQITGLKVEELHAQFDELQQRIAYLTSILTDDNLCKKVMKDELNELKEKFGDERRTKIIPAEHEFNAEDFYPNDPVVITVSHLGYIKRTPLSEFREQARGGVGSKGVRHREQDFTEFIYPATMHQTMLFFTKKGRCYWLKCYNIPEGTKDSKGRAIQNLLNIEPDDGLNAILRLRGLDDEEFVNSHNVVFATKNGTIKKTSLEAYSRPRANGVIAINIAEGDEVVDVRLTNGKNEIIMANKNGRAVRFNEETVRAMGRTATGVRGMKLDGDDDQVVGMIVVNDAETENVMVVSETGYGKRSSVEDYRVTNRGGKGVKTLNITEKTGRVVAIKNVNDDNDLMIINKSGITIRLAVSEVRVMGRATQGVRLINLSKKNDVIASVCKVMSSELEAAAEEESRSEFDKAQEELDNTTTSNETSAETTLENTQETSE